MSLGLRILSAIVLLAAALGVKLSIDSAAAWRESRNAQMLLISNTHSASLLAATGALAAERGLVNGVLAKLGSCGFRDPRRLSGAAGQSTRLAQ